MSSSWGPKIASNVFKAGDWANTNDRNGWWEVQFAKEYEVFQVGLQGSAKYAYGLANAEVYIDDQLCGKTPERLPEKGYENKWIHIECPKVLKGKKVRVQKTNHKHLRLGGIEVK